MRTVKASEVVKGMRVQVDSIAHNVHVSIVGDVCEATHSANTSLTFEDGTQKFYTRDHPVTVLAEPKPEWVEGAWYWVEIEGTLPGVRLRIDGGWAATGTRGERAIFRDDRDNVTVLGRVLIVDWPGDDVALELDAINDGNRSTSLSNYGRTTMHDTILRNVADAIRTQGGVR